MAETSNNPFGNLTFSRYTVETDAERCLLAMQAALTVKGTDASRSLKKVVRLKRAMQNSSSVRKYTFALTPTVKPAAVAPALPETTHSDLISAVAEKVLGLGVRASEVKTATSGHLILKVVLGGRPAKALNAAAARSEIAVRLAKHRDLISSCAVQPLTVRTKGKLAAVSFQCIYRVQGA